MSTIVDVCKLAGVSKATVSRVINGTGQVKESTREMVFAAMDQLGYRPNKLAQSLATNRTNSISLVMSDFEEGHLGQLLKQAAASLSLAQKQLIVTDGNNDPVQEYEIIRQLEGGCDAVILYSRTLSDEHIKRLNEHLTIPLVVMNRCSDDRAFHTVSFDQQGTVGQLMDLLIGFGHRQIACITGPLDNPTGQARLLGYKNALKNSGIGFQRSWIESGDYGIKSGYMACKSLISRGIPFTSIVAFNDNMALGALNALVEAGIKVPQQMSIAGIDNDPITEFIHPTLTTISLPVKEMAKQAVELAIELSMKKKPPVSHLFRGKLIARESVIPLQAQKGWLEL